MLLLPAFATHERDHRFTVSGTVRDGTRFPGVRLPNQTVVVRDVKTKKELQRGLTDADGKFSIVLHVHNSDVGKLVLLESGGVAKQLELTFEPDDIATERQAQVDIVVFTRSTPGAATQSK
jgi:hypothetical protein